MVDRSHPAPDAGRFSYAKTSKRDVINVIQTKTGMRIIVMPGARMLMMVTMKFSAPATDDAPNTSRLMDQKSRPRLTLKGFSVRLA